MLNVMLSRHLPKLPPWLVALVAVGSSAVAVVLLARAVDGEVLRRTGEAMRAEPVAVVVVLASFAFAFVLRSWLWVRVLPDLTFGQSFAAINLALGANHVLPFRLGEPLRIVSVVKRQHLSIEATTASTLTLRSADILAIGILGLATGPAAFSRILGPWGWVAFGLVAAVGLAGIGWMLKMRRADASDAGVSEDGAAKTRIVLPGPVVAIGSLVAWLFEAVLVWQAAHFAGIDLTPRHAVLITAIAVSAQIVAITPGGIGTYEAASVAAYVALGYDAKAALAAAITAHALKTAYSLVAGGIGVFVPRPSLSGRLRLDRVPLPDRAHQPTVDLTADPAVPANPDAPVVLFLPAHNEEASVADVLARVPTQVRGHPVHCLVIDDGSTDATVERARAAGATVIAHDHNRGLGAAVRTGLRAAVDLDAAAIAFCDADGEYAPEELAVLVGPVLDGTADYVVGTRLRGTIEHMRPHRRVGNIVLTRALAYIARTDITDGQSGYRAFSPAAARSAEVVHDYNYAQVITLDLLPKGFRYVEVPITYHFRTTGRSFIRLGRYLRKVGPAVYREVNGSAATEPGGTPAAPFDLTGSSFPGSSLSTTGAKAAVAGPA